MPTFDQCEEQYMIRYHLTSDAFDQLFAKVKGDRLVTLIDAINSRNMEFFRPIPT